MSANAIDPGFTDQLHATLGARPRPEDIAEMLLAGAVFEQDERKLLEQAAAHASMRRTGGASAMSDQFFAAVPPSRQVETALGLFKTATPLSQGDIKDVATLRAFAEQIGAEIHKEVGASSFLNDRLGRAARQAQGLDLSRRRYNKLFRFLRRFERKLDTYDNQLRGVGEQMIAKSGIAQDIPREDFAASPEAACFVAYYAARRNRRSLFTNTGQDPAFDEIAQMLLARFKRSPSPQGWRAIAFVMPDLEIVAELSDEAKLALIAAWLDTLHALAERMRTLWDESQFDRATMIVRRGQNSSAWNAMAGAWNMARQGWLAAIAALGMDDVLDLVCLGKAMRLMAADVAHWQGDLHADTRVWAELPAPWEVLAGDAECTRLDVELACARNDVDPVGSGWVAPRQDRRPVRFRPTPESVHGVAVGHPELATILRKAGWFSGGAAHDLPDGLRVSVKRDPQGAAVEATYEATSHPLWRRLFGWAGLAAKSAGQNAAQDQD